MDAVEKRRISCHCQDILSPDSFYFYNYQKKSLEDKQHIKNWHICNGNAYIVCVGNTDRLRCSTFNLKSLILGYLHQMLEK
jgi:hypothetical protein